MRSSSRLHIRTMITTTQRSLTKSLYGVHLPQYSKTHLSLRFYKTHYTTDSFFNTPTVWSFRVSWMTLCLGTGNFTVSLKRTWGSSALFIPTNHITNKSVRTQISIPFIDIVVEIQQ